MKCCHTGHTECDREAEYAIIGRSGLPEDETFSCSQHVGALLGDPMLGGVPVPALTASWSVFPIEEARKVAE